MTPQVVVDNLILGESLRIGFNFPQGGLSPGIFAVVTADGDARSVAENLAFPNGMVVTPDDRTPIVAEPYANRLIAFDIGERGTLSNRRVWADPPGDHPDGICLDDEGAVWAADFGNKHRAQVRERGEVLRTIDVDRGCFLYLVAAQWPEDFRTPTGHVLSVQVDVQAAN